MKTEEIKYKIEQTRMCRDLVNIEANKEIDRLKAQLAESKKSESEKLGHGDFGIASGGEPIIVVGDGKCSHTYDKDKYEHYMRLDETNGRWCKATKFGNIFDITKDWGEDLEEFSYLDLNFKMEGNSLKISIGINRYQTITGINIQMMVWLKFGQMIMTLKQKKS